MGAPGSPASSRETEVPTPWQREMVVARHKQQAHCSDGVPGVLAEGLFLVPGLTGKSVSFRTKAIARRSQAF